MIRFFCFAIVAGLCLLARPVSAAELPESLVTPYLALQASLAGDSMDGVPANATALATAAGSLGTDAEAIVKGAHAVAKAGDIKTARTAFGELSDALVTYTSTIGADLGGLRVAYCPMVNRPWLQRGGDVRNPYYGSSMLTCGVFKK